MSDSKQVCSKCGKEDPSVEIVHTRNYSDALDACASCIREHKELARFREGVSGTLGIGKALMRTMREFERNPREIKDKVIVPDLVWARKDIAYCNCSLCGKKEAEPLTLFHFKPKSIVRCLGCQGVTEEEIVKREEFKRNCWRCGEKPADMGCVLMTNTGDGFHVIYVFCDANCRTAHMKEEAEMILCDGCGVKGKDRKKCGRCGQQYYCGKECQAKAWPTHKVSCKAPTVPEVAIVC